MYDVCGMVNRIVTEIQLGKRVAGPERLGPAYGGRKEV